MRPNMAQGRNSINLMSKSPLNLKMMTMESSGFNPIGSDTVMKRQASIGSGTRNKSLNGSDQDKSPWQQ